MTTPKERSRNVIQAGAFLKELRANEDLPERIRDEAHRLLRHYPNVGHIELVARYVPPPGDVFDLNPFGGPVEPDWWDGYRFGPVRD